MTKKSTFLFVLGLVFGAYTSFGQCSDIFFSEYIEGSGNNKALEIYNPSDTAVNLANYEIYRFNNGAVVLSDSLTIPHMLAPGEVYVIGNASADPLILAQSDTTHSMTFYNGDDVVMIVNHTTGDTVDVIGQLGVDPGTNWPVGTGATSEFTLVRMMSVNEGTKDWNVGATQWDVFPQNTFDSLGAHTMTPCSSVTPGSGCTTDIFFSEYIEGSGNNKAVEIYNPSDTVVNLGVYKFYRFNNGSVIASDSLFINHTLAPGEVYVVGNASGDPLILAQSDTTHSLTFYNGDDVLLILNTVTGDTTDVIGQLGVDPGTNWPVGTGATSEYTLVRMASINAGINDWTIGATQWEVFPQNYFDSLGAHTMTPCSSVNPGNDSTGCTTDIFFSEYIEGSSNNKAVEIFNPSDSVVDLTNYTIYRYGNGSPTPTDTFELSGTLAPGAVHISANNAADPAILAVADDSIGFPGVITFNGDDAMAILNESTGLLIDVIGEIGNDPGTNWPVGAGATSEFTLVRMPSIHEGTTDWAIGATQWLVFPQNTFDSLGSHYMIPCNAPVPDSPSVSFAPTAANVSEGAGTAAFDVVIANGGADTVAVQVVFDAIASTATLGVDFTWSDTTIVFPANATSPISLSVALIDDADVESDETIVVNLINPTNGSLIGAGTFTLTINDNDYIEYPIGLVTADADGDGQTDSLGVKCQVRGIVHGIDLQGGTIPSVLFTMIDSTGGIAVFSGNNFGYVVTEGDEVIVQGVVGSFNGLAEFTPPDNIILVSQGNPTVTPMVVTTLDEISENELVTIECLTMVDPSQWPSTVGGSVNINMTNGVDTFVVRIDSDVDINGSPAPVGKWLSVTGLGGQFDPSYPYNDGYQLLPRYIADIVENPDPVVGFDESAISVDESAGNVNISLSQADGNPDTTEITVAVAASSTATEGTDFTLSGTSVSLTGCGADTAALVVTIVDDTDVEGTETIVLTITTVTNNAMVSTDTVVITISETDGIADLLPSGAIRLFPNPSKDVIFWNSDYRIENMVITNLLGQEVVNKVNPAVTGSMEISNLPEGVYIIRMQTTKGLWMQKWMKK
ncbi:MAG: lamin tail domain-containing protein [Bacteroidia bacterium]